MDVESIAERPHVPGLRERRHSAGDFSIHQLDQPQSRRLSDNGVSRLPESAGSYDGPKLQRSNSVPGPARWTVAADVYHHRTLVLTFTDPFLPHHLGSIIKSDMRLLKLYESGLPSWAVFLPSYGLYYRPWMRTITWTLFVAISIISMALGFYDLYKNVPYLKQVVGVLASKLYEYIPTASGIFQWLEEHTQLRLSILLTYLFSKSPLFLSTLRLLSNAARVLSSCLEPLASRASWALTALVDSLTSTASPLVAAVRGCMGAVWSSLGAALAPLMVGVKFLGGELLELCSTAGGAGAYCIQALLGAGQAVLGPPLLALQAMVQLVVQVLMPVWQALRAVLLAGSSAWGAVAAAAAQLAASAGWYLSACLGSVRAGWAALKAGTWLAAQGARTSARMVAAAVPAAKQTVVATQQTIVVAKRSGVHLLLLEAWDLLSTTAVKVVKALQAVLRFLIEVAMALQRHRSSLAIELRSRWRRMCARLHPYTAPFMPWGRPQEQQQSVVEARLGSGSPHGSAQLRHVQSIADDLADLVHSSGSVQSLWDEASGDSDAGPQDGIWAHSLSGVWQDEGAVGRVSRSNGSRRATREAGMNGSGGAGGQPWQDDGTGGGGSRSRRNGSRRFAREAGMGRSGEAEGQPWQESEPTAEHVVSVDATASVSTRSSAQRGGDLLWGSDAAIATWRDVGKEKVQ